MDLQVNATGTYRRNTVLCGKRLPFKKMLKRKSLFTCSTESIGFTKFASISRSMKGLPAAAGWS